jgi:hypothetical protein
MSAFERSRETFHITTDTSAMDLGLRRFGLVTRDAHRLYEKLGFTALANPPGHMEIARPGMYLKASSL